MFTPEEIKKVSDWVASEEGRKSILEGEKEAQKEIEEMRKAIKFDPYDYYFTPFVI